ncbi:MAG: hypothetical protein LH614_13375 [Pyrinomonadaceae bacterium]|nr:hypothetical protein [Pyrinomonadaceae bacterium]
MKKSFFDPEILNPDVSIFSSCPTCQGLIPIKLKDADLCLEERICPHCGIEIYENEIIEAAGKNIVTTQAISSANKIASFDMAVVVFLGVSLLTFLFNQVFLTILFIGLTLTAWTIPLIFCIRWFHKHGRWLLNDEDYLSAKSEIKKSGLLWSAAHLLNILLTIFRVSQW